MACAYTHTVIPLPSAFAVTSWHSANRSSKHSRLPSQWGISCIRCHVSILVRSSHHLRCEAVCPHPCYHLQDWACKTGCSGSMGIKPCTSQREVCPALRGTEWFPQGQYKAPLPPLFLFFFPFLLIVGMAQSLGLIALAVMLSISIRGSKVILDLCQCSQEMTDFQSSLRAVTAMPLSS